MRMAVVLMMFVWLPSCSPEKTQSIGSCQTEADRFYQGYQNDDINNPRSRYIIECMASKGYEFDVSPRGCNSQRLLLIQPACYVATSWVARTVERLFER